jgi:L-asparaginase II
VHAVAVQGSELVAEAGNRGLVALFRSSAKPLQALPLVRARNDLDEAEVAVACASHQAEPAQLEAVRSLLAKAPAEESELECGPQEGRGPDPICHNCSGKHAGFLAVCRARGWESGGYRLSQHPLQRELRLEVAQACEALAPYMPTAVDGCGVVTFGLSLEAMARGFAALEQLEGGARVAAAMRSRPELVGGEGADDTALMRALPGWTAKRGAEGLLCAVSEDRIGVALKSEDGNPRPLRPAAAAFLRHVGIELDEFASIPVENSRGEQVGEVVADPSG